MDDISLVKQNIFELIERWQTAVSRTNLMQPPRYTGTDHALTNIVDNTADVERDSAFVARVGTVRDGHAYIEKAILQGAKLIIGQHNPDQLAVPIPDNVTYWQVDNSSEVYAWLSAAWYGFPSHEMVVAGVTGTDGKTTTVNFLHQMLLSAGIKAGMLSTIKAMIGTEEEPLALHVTTPEAPIVQRYLRRMVDAGVTHCVLETTSHGLAQHRVTAVDYDIAIITNITHEHLDYHGTHDAYIAAKKQLFRYVATSELKKQGAPQKTLILNADDPTSFRHLQSLDAPLKLRYSLESDDADLFANRVQLHPWSTQFDLRIDEETVSVTTKMFGQFNIYNILAASAAAHVLGLTPSQIGAGINGLSQLYGRMQLIDRGQPFLAIVDFAHTPNSLAKAIDTARMTLRDTNKSRGRIITVFGSAGLRDPAKRELMAKVSAQSADITVLTAEDPRTESLDDILATMAAACSSAGGVEGRSFFRVHDRGVAIYFALSQAEPDDLVLICGKGHEQSMCFGVIEYPWDDIRATQTALEALLEGREMPDLGLPTYQDINKS